MNWYKNIFRDKQQEDKIFELALECNALRIDVKNLHSFLETEELFSFILKWLLLLSISGNIGQLIYYLI